LNEINFDWDSITNIEAQKRCMAIMEHYNFIEKMKLYQSSSLDGCHAVATPFYYLNPVFRYRIRRAWGDDGKRLVEDVLKKSAPFRDVMFSKKIKIKMGQTMIFERIPLFLFTRSNGEILCQQIQE